MKALLLILQLYAVDVDCDSTPGATGYRFYRSDLGAALNTLPVPSCALTDTNVVEGQTYTYSVTAVSLAGESAKSAPVTVMVPPNCTTTPLKVIGVSWPALNRNGKVVGNRQLRWDSSSSPITSFQFKAPSTAVFTDERGCMATIYR